jgi:serine/threonine protein kinase/tetratricopeptide (TPR) repeat protein
LPSEESENEGGRERDLSGRAALESAREAELLDTALDRVLEVAFATPLPAVELRSPVRDAGEDRGIVLGGRYQLEELLGEGGMGTVWRAKQTEPVEREVALKLIKKGMDSRLIVSRFDAERQALALMDHPHIARVYDGGLAPDGRPYFVMELVRGVPINAWCRDQRATLTQRLELFLDVCQAIQHAHQKGIIHRDIKPSNILVARDDEGQPTVKVIDFGVAKVLEGGDLAKSTVVTAFGSIMGTPEYMSPEQATLGGGDIDTRADIYSLGVLLYELLTGSPPFVTTGSAKPGLLEVLRAVREDEPTRPSTRVMSAETRPEIQERLPAPQQQLAKLLSNDLDWVVMKALEKDRTRRYETANGLAADVRRYLAGQPVLAHPPGKLYQLSKFARRNPGLLVSSGLLLASLLIGLVGTSWGLQRARQEQENTEQALKVANRERAEAMAAREREAAERLTAESARKEALAQREVAEAAANAARLAQQAEAAAREQESAARQRAESNAKFMGEYFFNFSKATQSSSSERIIEPGARKAVLSLLDRGREQLAAQSDLEPSLAAQLNWTVGFNYQSYGEYSSASECFEQAWKLYEQAQNPIFAVYVRRNLAEALALSGKRAEALRIQEENLRRIIELTGPNDSAPLIYERDLALAYRESGRPDDARRLAEECLKKSEAMFEPDNDFLASARQALGSILLAQNEFPRAIALFQAAYDRDLRVSGSESASTAGSLFSLGQAYERSGNLDVAESLYEQAVERLRNTIGEDHPTTVYCVQSIGRMYVKRGKLDRGTTLLRDTLENLQRNRYRHPRAEWLFSRTLMSLERIDLLGDAENWYRDWIGVHSGPGGDPLVVARGETRLANCFRLRKKTSAAIASLKQVADKQKVLGAPDWDREVTQFRLGQVLASVEGDTAEEGRILREQSCQRLLRIAASGTTEQRLEVEALLEDFLQQLEAESDSGSKERWQRELEKLRAPRNSPDLERLPSPSEIQGGAGQPLKGTNNEVIRSEKSSQQNGSKGQVEFQS